MKVIQKFSDEYLQRFSAMSPNDIAQFLEDFRCLHGKQKAPSKLISIKIPADLLQVFKTKYTLNSIPYQTQIKSLMSKWVEA